jgi:hypothetical protein
MENDMARRKSIYDEIPQDIREMSLNDLRISHEYHNSAAGQAAWDELVQVRDEAQEKLHTELTRRQHVLTQMVRLMEQQKRNEE